MISQLSFLQLLLVFQVSVLLAIWYLVFREYQRDAFRQRVFLLRDRLFDYIGSSSVSYDDAAHVWLRNLLNGSIRFSDRTDFITLAFASIVLRRYRRKSLEDPDREFNSILEELDDEQVKEELVGFRDEFKLMVLSYLVRTSVIIWVYLAVAVVIALVGIAGPRRTRTQLLDEKPVTTVTLPPLGMATAEECSYRSGTGYDAPIAAVGGC